MRGAVCSHSTAKLCSIPLYSPSLRARGADANITQTFCFKINHFRFIENLRLSLGESEPQTTLHVLTDSLVFTSCRFNLALQYLCHFSVLIFARPSIRHWLDPAGDGGLGELPPPAVIAWVGAGVFLSALPHRAQGHRVDRCPRVCPGDTYLTHYTLQVLPSGRTKIEIYLPKTNFHSFSACQKLRCFLSRFYENIKTVSLIAGFGDFVQTANTETV